MTMLVSNVAKRLVQALTATFNAFVLSLAASGGAAMVGWLQAGAGAVQRLVRDKLRESISAEDFGAVGDGVADDTAAVQAAADACPFGGVLYLRRKYKLTAAIRITKPMTIAGDSPGSFINDTGGRVQQVTAGQNAFTMVASVANYAFGQWGVIDVHFRDIAITGPAFNSNAKAGVGVDTSINAGDFHVRECSFTNVVIRYFDRGIDLEGIAYLNRWFNVSIQRCGTCVRIARGAASDLGGQNRFYGCSLTLCSGVSVSLNEDTVGGSFAFFGCTFEQCTQGIRTNEEANLTVIGCEFESLVSGGNGAGIYIPIAEANPNAQGPKVILGNKFLGNDADIWIDKTTAAGSAGGFHWPMQIDANYLGSAQGLKITVPGGHVGLDSPAFVFGESNSGLDNGPVAPSQISANFMGTDRRKRRITRRYVIQAGHVSGAVIDSLPVGMVVQAARLYMTANASAFTELRLGDQTADAAYLTIANGNTQGLNVWLNWAAPVPQRVLTAATNQLRMVGTAGILNARAVIEIDGYMP